MKAVSLPSVINMSKYSPYHWSIASTQIAVRVINNKDFNLLMYQKPNKAYTECKLIIDIFIF